ncbi:AraC family transcriptional regulator [Acidaminobacter sp. JC074]|uniref:helix-turn-helix domain-containing protein n=1 Tax=Acidaminobacter sp. JC074 TaxID=2530199 RepID=UPI001F0D9D92|nr:helix-turn-helix domain-containing protein [Acidaminobacter sp. JC074]MCH4886857.1 AraC family transcriptional regulator [Acidaminobacter sp. JC074]
MNIKKYIESVVDFVEEHLEEKLSVDIVADKIGYSKFYLHHIFKVYTGMTIMAYVRKRRLERSLSDLQTDLRVIDIAFKYGYGSEKAYARAFTAYFGKSPSCFRNVQVAEYKRLSVYDIKLPDEEWIKMVKDYLSDVRYENIGPIRVVSGKRVSHEPEEEIIGLMQSWKEKHGVKSSRFFGFDSPVTEEELEKGSRGYEFWLVLDEETDADLGEFVIKEIPAYKYASLRITNPFEDAMVKIPNGWKSMVAWLESNVEEILARDDKLDCLEEVVEIDGVTYMDIFVPISCVK